MAGIVLFVVLGTISVADTPAERTDPQAQEEFREEAHLLLESILDKNNEADDRRVCLCLKLVFVAPHCITTSFGA